MEKSCSRVAPTLFIHFHKNNGREIVNVGSAIDGRSHGLVRSPGHPLRLAKFSPCIHSGSPSLVNSVKARQSKHARALF